MDIIYNGEIYLKKGPEIYNPSADIKEIDENCKKYIYGKQQIFR